MLSNVNSTPSLSQLHKDISWGYGRMIIDQANAAAESNGQFFNKTNRFESFAQNKWRIDLNRELECSTVHKLILCIFKTYEYYVSLIVQKRF